MDKEKETGTPAQKGHNRGKRTALWTILGAALLILGVGVFYIHSIVNRPQSFFETTVSVTTVPATTMAPAFDIEQYLPTQAPEATDAPTQVPAVTEVPTTEPAATEAPTPEPTATEAPTPEPTATEAPTPEPTLTSAPTPAATEAPAQAEATKAAPQQTAQATARPTDREPTLTGMVNIALFGIDAYEDGSTTSGTMPHTDANMIVAVNFDTKEVSLISIARDLFTNIPGHNGFYKFNGVFNVGGGMDDPNAGLALSCRTAEMWLGGMSVPYYYGVDFQAVIDLVDALGGIDFDLDIELFSLDGMSIAKPGYQHLNGEQVFAYLRMRKGAGAQDRFRTARQRRMMIALFKMIQEEGKLSMIPELLKIMEDDVYTNTTIAQTAALASFAAGVDPDSIQSYSFQGTMHGGYDWRYCAVDQQERIEILKKVYGIDAEPVGVNSPVYEQFLHMGGFLALQHIGCARLLFDTIHSTMSPEDMTEEQKRLYATCWQASTELQTAFERASQWMQQHYDERIELTATERQERTDLYAAMTAWEEQVRESGDALNRTLDDPVKLGWTRDIADWYKQGSVINEVYVNFS